MQQNMMNSSLAGLVKSFESLRSSEHEFVLATIIETEGSTYRKAGARMLISNTGEFCGLLGGGCFESDLLEHAHKVFRDKSPKELFYDMRAPEDLIWGLGLGCNGAVRILLEYLSAENDFAPLSMLQSVLKTRHRSSLVTICESESPDLAQGQHFIVQADSDHSNDLPQAIAAAAHTTLENGKSSLQTLTISGKKIKAFFARIEPPVHLLVIGGGPDAVPVTRIAALLGWTSTVVDHREPYSKAENFPQADQVVHATPEQLRDKVQLESVNAVVLMTHKYEYDLRYLNQLACPSVRYIGLLGPVARRDELLRSANKTVIDELSGRIYGPVGLDIGGELPEEIAFSLIAEVQGVLNGRSGGHLSTIKDAEDTSRTEQLTGIVLAAGGSTRFGALKQLLEYNGASMLSRAVDTATYVLGNHVIVIHGPKATKCQREISSFDVQNIVNDNWESGISSSLKLAVSSVPPGCAAVLVMLCDQPLIEADHLKRLIAKWQTDPDKIVASHYGGTVGVPAIIPASCFADVMALHGDAGAKSVLSAFSNKLVSIDVPEAEFDIDTQQDFTDLLGRKLA